MHTAQRRFPPHNYQPQHSVSHRLSSLFSGKLKIDLSVQEKLAVEADKH